MSQQPFLCGIEVQRENEGPKYVLKTGSVPLILERSEKITE